MQNFDDHEQFHETLFDCIKLNQTHQKSTKKDCLNTFKIVKNRIFRVINEEKDDLFDHPVKEMKKNVKGSRDYRWKQMGNCVGCLNVGIKVRERGEMSGKLK